MVAPIPGDRFIRTLVHYLDTHQAKLTTPPPSNPSSLASHAESNTNGNDSPTITDALASFFNPAVTYSSHLFSMANTDSSASDQSASATNRPASLYGVQIPYMSLLAAASPNSFSLSTIPYMPPRSTFSLDIHHLYFLLVQFENLGLDIGNPALLGEIPAAGLVETETSSEQGKPPSIMSVGSIASTMSTLSLSSGWNFWQRRSPVTNKPIHQEIQDAYDYLTRISALKLHMRLYIDPHNGAVKSSQRPVVGYETPLPLDGSVILSLSVFRSLSYLELTGVQPKLFDGWTALRHRLISLVVKDAGLEDAADVIHVGSVSADGQTDKDIQHLDWTQLRMLSLAGNSLTSLDFGPCQNIRSVTHLNLSNNQLIDAPAALASLYNLRSLNLANNMISSVTGINTVLGNIQELVLSGNRLTLLAGLDRLWSLERLDLRDNLISDVGEVGRLTSLPNIEDIWVEGNPLTQMQPDYRVTLFSAFRACEIDIRLDGARPTFAERRRVSAATTKDTYHEPVAEVVVGAVSASRPQISSDSDGRAAIMEPAPVKTKIARAKTRRIVRLEKTNDQETADNDNGATGDVGNAIQGDTATKAATTKTHRSKSRAKHRQPSAQETSGQSPESSPEPAPTPAPAPAPIASPSPGTEALRRKIESMRREAGTGWLRVLKEMDLEKKNTK